MPLSLQLAKGETAAELEDAIRSGGEACIEQALREMGQGDLPAIEAEDYDMHGRQRVMILGINRARLTAYAHCLILFYALRQMERRTCCISTGMCLHVCRSKMTCVVGPASDVLSDQDRALLL
jgi:hypothetical protein